MSRWANLFKSRAVALKPDPRVRWFGKLPTYADYYRSNTDAEWAEEFNSWVLHGFEQYHGRTVESGSAKRRLPDSGCILRLPKSEMTVLASLQDYGGDMRGRPFPICFYVGTPSPPWPGPTHDRWVRASVVLDALTGLRDHVTRFFRRPGRFEAIVDGQEVELGGVTSGESDDARADEAARIPIGEWFASAKSNLAVDDLNTWLRLTAAWGELIRQCESESFEPTLRFPLATALPTAVQTAGWLRWLGARMDLERRFLSLIISEQPDASLSTLTIIARTLIPEDFLLATPAFGTLPYLDDLCRRSPPETREDGKDQAAAAAVAPEAEAQPEATGTWRDFTEGKIEVAA